jgi:hypothetical protein
MVIPEYGRNVQKMIDFACTIEDKEERNKVAGAIISVMGQLNPHLRDITDFNHKLWAHLFIMSEFKLEVDSPYPVPSPESFTTKPDTVPYPTNKIRFGHYGKTVELLIEAAIKYEDGEEKFFLVGRIANLMKRSNLQWNSVDAKDETILKDLDKISEGKLKVAEGFVFESFSDLMKKSPNKKRNFKGKGKNHKGGRNFKKRN